MDKTAIIKRASISKDQVIGGLILTSCKVNAYTNMDLKIVESIGIQIAGAIANA